MLKPEGFQAAFPGQRPGHGTPAEEAVGVMRPKLSSAVQEVAAYLRPRPVVNTEILSAEAAKGDGHSVMILPALLSGDENNTHVREFLEAAGYRAFGWGLGTNTGPTDHIIDGAAARLSELFAANGKVSLVGFSMGGLIARWLGQKFPAKVRQVITVGSPFRNSAQSTIVPMEAFLNLWPQVRARGLIRDIEMPLAVPSTSIFSRDDGVVDWRSCRDPSAADDVNVEVEGTHVHMSANNAVLRVLAARLARKITADGKGFAKGAGSLPVPVAASGLLGKNRKLSARWGI